MWIIDKIPGSSRIANATVVVMVVVTAVSLVMALGTLLHRLPPEVVTGSATASMSDVRSYKAQMAYIEAVGQDTEDDLVESITDLIDDLGDLSLYEQLVGQENTPEQNLANFRWVFCSETTHLPLEVAEMMIDAEMAFNRLRAAGMFPENTGDFWVEVVNRQC